MTATEPGCPSAGPVAGVAREVEALRREVAELRELPQRVDTLAQVLADALDATTDAPAEPVEVMSWLDLPTDVEQARRVLDELTTWLHQVYLRYRDGAAHLPGCWMWHPDIVEELLWLHSAWHAAYRDEATASISRVGDWHDRYRPGAVRRIKTYSNACSLDVHLRGREERLTTAPPVYAAAEIATWWATHRDGTPPEPTREQLDHASRAYTRSRP